MWLTEEKNVRSRKIQERTLSLVNRGTSYLGRWFEEVGTNQVDGGVAKVERVPFPGARGGDGSNGGFPLRSSLESLSISSDMTDC